MRLYNKWAGQDFEAKIVPFGALVEFIPPDSRQKGKPELERILSEASSLGNRELAEEALSRSRRSWRRASCSFSRSCSGLEGCRDAKAWALAAAEGEQRMADSLNADRCLLVDWPSPQCCRLVARGIIVA